ncbi:MAG: endonuclease III domain-containing protein, partial [Planctomycetota bacterium]
LLRYYRSLRRHFGHRDWWPGDTPFEVMVGAILTQNTAWTNVEKAIANLKSCGALDPRRMAAIDARTLAAAVRPAGYFRVKARRLKSFLSWMSREHGLDVRRMKRVPMERMRNKLLSVKGIGPETADSILLYALGKPTFVVDAYTHRVLTRHGLIHEDAGYDEMKELFEAHLDRDLGLFQDFHAQFVAVGKDFCRPRPRCDACPLRPLLPH